MLIYLSFHFSFLDIVICFVHIYKCQRLMAARPPTMAALAHFSVSRCENHMEMCRTSGVWLESKSILRKLPRESEVVTKH